MKKLISILLVLAMVLALAPMVFASEEAVIDEEAIEEIEEIEEEPAAEPEEAPALDGAVTGTCGTNVSWSLDTTSGVLTVSGTGYMDDYNMYTNDQPWYSYKASIKSVVIKDGVKSVGEDAFSECYDLPSVTLGNSVETIGDGAFCYCDLKSVKIPDSVVSIGDFAFYNNEYLTSVTLGNSVKTIGEGAFAWCDLQRLTLPDSITSIGEEAFYSNPSLLKVVRPAHDITIGERAFGWCWDDDYYDDYYISVEFVYAEAKPTLTFAADAKSVKASGDFSGLYARVALVLDNNGVSGLYITQATINDDGTILIPEFKVPGLKVKGVNVALVPTLADVQSTTPNAKATATKML